MAITIKDVYWFSGNLVSFEPLLHVYTAFVCGLPVAPRDLLPALAAQPARILLALPLFHPFTLCVLEMKQQRLNQRRQRT